MTVFPNFLNFFAIWLEFSILGRVETRRKDFYYFLSFSAFPILFRLEMKLWWCFLIFWIFLVFLFSFLLRVGKEHISTIFIILSLSRPFSHSILAWNEAMLVFSNFFEFFCYFFKISITSRPGTHRNDFLYFFSFVAFPNLFSLEKKLWWYFLIFKIFLLFFWNFLFRVG